MRKISVTRSFVYSCLVIWCTLLFVRICVVNDANQFSKSIAQLELAVHAFTLLWCFKVYKNSPQNERRTIIWLLVIVYGIFFNDLIFYINAYRNNSFLIGISLSSFVFTYFAYLSWIVATIIFLTSILIKYILTKSSFVSRLVPFAVTNIIIMYMFISSSHSAFPLRSIETWLIFNNFLFDLIIFNLTILCLIYVEDIDMSITLLGLALIICGDFFATHTFFSQTTSLLSYGELLWFLGLICILFGLIRLGTKKEFSLAKCFSNSNTIKSKLAIWSFSMSITGFLIFFIIARLFSIIDKVVFLGFPLLLMIYSVIVVISSVLIGRKFELPFKQIQLNIENLMLNNNKDAVNSNFSIQEFVFLQQYIMNAFSAKEKHDQIKYLGKMASHVAHNIRSPLTVMNNLIESIRPQISEEFYDKFNDQLFQIRELSNNFLEHNRTVIHYNENQTEYSYCRLSNLLDLVVKQKNIEWANQPCNIKVIYHTNETIWLYVLGYEFRTMLSNLINNSYEAMPDEKHDIEIHIDSDKEFSKIMIKDQGIGIPEHELENIMYGKSLKPSGNGIGLSSAIIYVQSLKGGLNLRSTSMVGTEIRIMLPKITLPRWYLQEIRLLPNCMIAIIDADYDIHAIWQRKFFTSELKVMYFTNSIDFRRWYIDLVDTSQILVLMDYDLYDSASNSIDMLKELQITKAILVTNYADHSWLQKQITTTPYYLVNKSILKSVPVII